MATITGADGKPVTEQAQIAALVALGMPRVQAAFVVALEAGRVGGDVVAIDEDENEATPPGKTI